MKNEVGRDFYRMKVLCFYLFDHSFALKRFFFRCVSFQPEKNASFLSCDLSTPGDRGMRRSSLSVGAWRALHTPLKRYQTAPQSIC